MMNVYDKKSGQLVDGLKAPDFAAKLGGRPADITEVTQQINNRVLVLVETKVQKGYPGVSGLAENVIQQARNAPDGRPIAFGAFGRHALLTDGFLSEKSARARAIDDVIARQQPLEAKSGLYDALHEALLLFGDHQPGDTILLVSDGHDSKSTISSRDIANELMAGGVRLNILTGEWGYDLTHPEAHKAANGTLSNTLRVITRNDGLMPFAERTGGLYRYARAERAVEASWVGYLVELQLPAKPDNTKLEVEVRDASGKPSKTVWVMHPPQLAPCTASLAAR